MTDDIVTRLRASIDGDYFGSREDMKEAVAEIERLRAALNELSRLGSIGAIIPDKAVRGE